jgi:phenylalanyl-tRNA synthetase beta subunit
VPEGKVSLSLRLTFRSAERTLTDAEVQSAMDGVLAALRDKHDAVQR